MTRFQQKPPSEQAEADGNEHDGAAAPGSDAEESKLNNMQMDTGLEEGGNTGQNNRYRSQRRLTLEEFQNQYAQRLQNEFQVFGYATAKIETLLDKNAHMERFIFRVFREVETSYVTTAEQPQCVLQMTNLAKDQLNSLIRLL